MTAAMSATGQLEAETRQLLENLDQPDPEQSTWLQEATGNADDR